MALKRNASSSSSAVAKRQAKGSWSEYTGGKELPANVSTATAKRGASFSCQVIETNLFRTGSKVGRPVLSVNRKQKDAEFGLVVDLTGAELFENDANVRWISPDTIEFSPIDWKINKTCKDDVDAQNVLAKALPLVRRIKHGDILQLRTQYHSDFAINVGGHVRTNGVYFTPEIGISLDATKGKTVTQRVWTNCTDMGPDTNKCTLDTGVRGASTDGLNYMYNLFVSALTPLITPWRPDIPFNNGYRTIIMPWFVTPIEDVNTNNPGFSAVLNAKWGKGDGEEGQFEESYEKKETQKHEFYHVLSVQSDGIVRYPELVKDEASNKWRVEKGHDINFSIKAEVSSNIVAMLGPNHPDYQKDICSWLLQQLQVIFIVKQDVLSTEGLSYNREDYHKSNRFGLAGKVHFMYSNLVKRIPELGLQINRALVLDLLNPKNKKPNNAQWKCSIDGLKELNEQTNNSIHKIDYDDFVYLNESTSIPEEGYDFYLLVEPLVLDQIINALLSVCPKAIEVVPIEEEFLEKGCSSFEPLLVNEGKDEEYLAALRKILFPLTSKTIYHLYAIPESKPSPMSLIVTQPKVLDEYLDDYKKLIANFEAYEKKHSKNSITNYFPIANGEETRRSFFDMEQD